MHSVESSQCVGFILTVTLESKNTPSTFRDEPSVWIYVNFASDFAETLVDNFSVGSIFH